MYIIWFNCCGLAVSAIILLSYYTRNRIPIIQNRIFIYQVWCVIVTTCCNLFLGIMQNQAHPGMEEGQLLLMNIAAFIYHTMRMVNGFLYMYYILVVLNIVDKSVKQFLYLYVPTIIALTICFLGPFWNLVFFIDSNGIHHPGSLMPALYLIALYYMLLIVFLTVYYRKMILLSRRIAFHSFGTLVMGTVLIERMFPTIMVEGFGSALCQLLIYLTLQKGEEVIDGSSGLLNKLSFLHMISIRLKQKVSFDLLVIELENFSFLQKSLGLYVMGLLLTKTGAYLRSVMPKRCVYRVSEKTICVILNQSDRVYSQQLIKQLEERYQDSWEAGNLITHLAIHITLFHCPEELKTLDEIMDLVELSAADMQEGRKEYFMQGQNRKRVQEVENAITAALENKSFTVVYQPIYSASHGRFRSAEALLRLDDKKLGQVRPDEFIPIAEKSGLIVDIGKFVLEEVCRFISRNNLAELGLEYIEVNLSVVECLHDNLVDNVMEILNRNGVDSKFINFEITETASETFPETVMQNLNRLAERGICFSLDDYGTGYSNIKRILTMPLRIIKLDKEIIHAYFSMETSEADIVMLETMRMFKKLNKLVVAEGIETKEQAERLIRMGCEFLQGYYFARPMSSGDLIETLSSKI